VSLYSASLMIPHTWMSLEQGGCGHHWLI